MRQICKGNWEFFFKVRTTQELYMSKELFSRQNMLIGKAQQLWILEMYFWKMLAPLLSKYNKRLPTFFFKNKVCCWTGGVKGEREREKEKEYSSCAETLRVKRRFQVFQRWKRNVKNFPTVYREKGKDVAMPGADTRPLIALWRRHFDDYRGFRPKRHRI